MRNNYILVATDTESVKGARVSSKEIAAFRIEENLWPLYAGTRNRKMMAPGDRLLIYCGGTRAGARSIIASATIDKVADVRRPNSVAELQKFLSNSPSLMIEMTNIVVFTNPVSVRPILEKLDCCPSNLSKWGVIFFGGVRRISDADFAIISELGYST